MYKVHNDVLKYVIFALGVVAFALIVVITSVNTNDTYAFSCDFESQEACEAMYGKGHCVDISIDCWVEDDNSYVPDDGSSCYFDSKEFCESTFGDNNCVENPYTGCWEEKTGLDDDDDSSCEFSSEQSCLEFYGNCEENPYTGCWEEKIYNGDDTTSCIFDSQDSCESTYGEERCEENLYTGCWEEKPYDDEVPDDGSGEYPNPDYEISEECPYGGVYDGVWCALTKVVVASENFSVGDDLSSSDDVCHEYLDEKDLYGGFNDFDNVCEYDMPVIKYLKGNDSVSCYANHSDESEVIRRFDVCDGGNGVISVYYSEPDGWAYSKQYDCYISSDNISDQTSSSCVSEPLSTYSITYDGNGGSGVPSVQTKTEGIYLKLSSLKPTKVGYTFVNWNTSSDGTGTSYASGAKYNTDEGAILYAQWKVNEYKISYQINGGIITGVPTSGTYNQELTINNPTKNVTVKVNDNKMNATIGSDEKASLSFDGWTSSDIDTKNAYYGDKLWSNGSTNVKETKFKNLSVVDGATVTMVANWSSKDITLPTVVKHGYNCSINTKADGKGTTYESGGKYTISANSTSSINLYAICEPYSKTDKEITTNNKTGDVLIYTVWIIGLGTLGFSIYYFMKRRNSL